MIGYEAAPRYAKAVQAITGDAEIVPPGLTLESDRPEWSYVKRERLWIATFVFGASAGNFNQFALSSSNQTTLSVVTHIFTDQTSRAGLSAIAGTAANGAIGFRDSRQAGKPNTKTVGKQAAGQLLTGAYLIIPAAVVIALPPFMFLATTFVVESNVVNVAHFVCLAGYERDTTPEERADA